MANWLIASFWGSLVGSALLFGAGLAYARPFTHHGIATVMAFGGGVLIALATADLMEEAYAKGGVLFSTMGLLTGALIFSAANILVGLRLISAHLAESSGGAAGIAPCG
jgi:ZIP family zinc transporter